MARPLRFQYPGAIYHIMVAAMAARRSSKPTTTASFSSSGSRHLRSCGWRVHARVLMPNHFHLLLETPQLNPVAGMKWLLGTFSQGWNRARSRQGHVFQGRYESVAVNASDSDRYYFRIPAKPCSPAC